MTTIISLYAVKSLSTCDVIAACMETMIVVVLVPLTLSLREWWYYSVEGASKPEPDIPAPLAVIEIAATYNSHINILTIDSHINYHA